MIQYERAEHGRKYLVESLGRKEVEGDFEFRDYEGLPHSLGQEELRDVVEWMKKRLA